MIRLLAIDIDGTLLDSRGEIPDANRDALGEAAARGVEVCLVTGRSFFFSEAIARALALPLTLVVSNGALVKNVDGTTLLKRLLPAADARDVLAATHAHRDACAVIFDRQDAQIVYDTMDWAHPNRRGYFDRNQACIVQAQPLESALTEDPIQVMFNGSVSMMRDLLSSLKRALGTRVEIALTEYAQRDFTLLDVMARGCSKGTMLAEWAGLRGIAPSEVMAVGDNFNDEQMLEFAGVPVVMGNAVAALKSRGWHLTGTHDEAGLATAIRTLVLRE
jgi:Cof subfamily protein (haloacid dehalogenase superfamily)